MKTIPIELSLTEFIQTGKFGFIKLGLSKNEIENQFFTPECWIAGETKESSRIWRYGNFELHFDDKTILSGIFNDYVPNMDGGESIILIDRWIIQESVAPTLRDAMGSLNTMKLDFKIETNTLDLTTITLQHGVYMTFENNDAEVGLDRNDYLLGVIGCRRNT